MHLLLLEDDVDLGSVLKHFLLLNNFRVTHLVTGKDLEAILETGYFNLCILDVALPDTDGFTIASFIRKKYPALPFIFLTAKTLKDDRILGLKIGAEDYITKPFEPEELLLRIKNIIKRCHPFMVHKEMIGVFTFEKENLLLYTDQLFYNLTLKEAELLAYLFTHKNKLIPKKEILKALWNTEDYFAGRSLDVFISRLRKYFSSEKSIQIENIRGIGFRFNIHHS